MAEREGPDMQREDAPLHRLKKMAIECLDMAMHVDVRLQKTLDNLRIEICAEGKGKEGRESDPTESPEGMVLAAILHVLQDRLHRIDKASECLKQTVGG